MAVNLNPPRAEDLFPVRGVKLGVAEAGVRRLGRKDLLLMTLAEGSRVAGVFTQNRFCAAPVQVAKEHLAAGSPPRALLVNTGNANAGTGKEGIARARASCGEAARLLGCESRRVLPFSTGVIMEPLPVDRILAGLPACIADLREDNWARAAEAIMTTDTVPKMASTTAEIGGKKITVGGIAKGSGMIAPDMATLLVFACTDASVGSEVLDYWTRAAADESFNCITVDGDTSTNDTLLVLAGGAAGNAPIAAIESEESRTFGGALTSVLRDLAIQVVKDGEGATKLVEIEVRGAPDRESAKRVALTVANSPLVKTAFFGEDANWGRIVAAAGRAGVDLAPERVGLFFGDLCVFKNGAPIHGRDVEEKASEVFKRKEIHVRLDLGMGSASFTAYTCDFSFDYVKINASYRS